MRIIKSVSLILVGLLLGIVGSGAGAHVGAQGNPSITPGQEILAGQPAGTIITGEDIGFQLVSPQQRDDVATGRLMIRINGRWVPAAAPTRLAPVK